MGLAGSSSQNTNRGPWVDSIAAGDSRPACDLLPRPRENAGYITDTGLPRMPSAIFFLA